MEMYRAPVDLSQEALVPIDLFLSGEFFFFSLAVSSPCFFGQRLSRF